MTIPRRPSDVLKQAERASIGAALCLYAAILTYVIPRHEPWADEAQAWQLAKYLPLHELFRTYIHYEGSPGLWHAFLWLLCRAYISYAGMHWVTGASALAAVALLAVASPLPFLLRISLPFTYFLVFQYAVIARSYSLFPPLLFALAFLWKHRWHTPLPIAVLIGLIANISIHGLATACGMAIVLAIEWFSVSAKSKQARRQLFISVLLLSLAITFAVWCVLPARDAGWVYRAQQMTSHTYFEEVRATSTHAHPWMAATPTSLQFALAGAFQLIQIFRHGLADRFQIGLILWALLAGNLMEKGLSRYLLPAICLALVSRPMPYHIYHAGLMWIVFLFICWATWHMRDRQTSLKALQRAMWSQRTLAVSIALCIAVQIAWAHQAIRYDIRYPYSPNRDGALLLSQYLKSGRNVDVAVPLKSNAEEGIGEFYATGLEPYFETQPIANMPFRFWFWGDQKMRDVYLQDSTSHANIILVEEDAEDTRYHIEETRLQSLGYMRDKSVCGQIIYPDMMSERLCHAFYTPPENNKWVR
ncbi:MAG: hypothetical protein NVS9B15_10950 [Acidobacteriaceae bacterium]